MIIKYKFKKGDISKYKTSVYSLREAHEGSYYEKLENKMEMAMTQKIVDVFSNGDGSLNVYIDSSTLWKDGKEIPIPKKSKSFTMKMADTGEIIESSGAGPQSPPSFPGKDINPGDTWVSEKEITVPSQGNTILLKTLHRFEGFERFNGFECVKISINTEKVSLDFDEGVTQIIDGNGVTYFCYSEGKLIKSEVNTYTTTSLLDAEITVTTRVIVNHEGTPENKKVEGDFLLSL